MLWKERLAIKDSQGRPKVFLVRQGYLCKIGAPKLVQIVFRSYPNTNPNCLETFLRVNINYTTKGPFRETIFTLGAFLKGARAKALPDPMLRWH